MSCRVLPSKPVVELAAASALAGPSRLSSHSTTLFRVHCERWEGVCGDWVVAVWVWL